MPIYIGGWNADEGIERLGGVVSGTRS